MTQPRTSHEFAMIVDLPQIPAPMSGQAEPTGPTQAAYEAAHAAGEAADRHAEVAGGLIHNITTAAVDAVWPLAVAEGRRARANDVVNVGYDPDDVNGEVVFWAEHGGVRRERRRTREQLDVDPDLGYLTVRELVEQIRAQA